MNAIARFLAAPESTMCSNCETYIWRHTCDTCGSKLCKNCAVIVDPGQSYCDPCRSAIITECEPYTCPQCGDAECHRTPCAEECECCADYEALREVSA